MLNRWWLPEGGHLRIIPSPFSSIDLEGVELCLTAGGSRREHLRIISPPLSSIDLEGVELCVTAGGSRREHLRIISPPLSSNDLEGVELCLTAGGSRRGTPADYPVSLPLFQQPRRRWGNQKNVAGHVWFDPFGVGGREKRRLSAGVPFGSHQRLSIVQPLRGCRVCEARKNRTCEIQPLRGYRVCEARKGRTCEVQPL